MQKEVTRDFSTGKIYTISEKDILKVVSKIKAEKKQQKKHELMVLRKEERSRTVERNKHMCRDYFQYGSSTDKIEQAPEGIKLLLIESIYGENESADNISSDSVNWLSDVLNRINSKLSADAHLLIFTDPKFSGEFRKCVSDCGYKYKKTLIWTNPNVDFGVGDITSFIPKFGCILHFVKGKPYISPRISDVVKSENTIKSPGAKPVDLLKKLIEVTTIEGEFIAGVLSGKGSTGIASQELARKFWLYEQGIGTISDLAPIK